MLLTSHYKHVSILSSLRPGGIPQRHVAESPRGQLMAKTKLRTSLNNHNPIKFLWATWDKWQEYHEPITRFQTKLSQFNPLRPS